MLQPIKILFSQFMPLCLFQQGPENIPHSSRLMMTLLGIAMLIGVVINLLDWPFPQAILLTLMNLLVLSLITWGLLQFYNKPERFIQTLSAQLGAGIIMTIIALPLLVMVNYAKQFDLNLIPIILLSLIIFVWNLAVAAHIYRHAIDQGFALGLFIAFSFFLLTVQLTYSLFPQV